MQTGQSQDLQGLGLQHPSSGWRPHGLLCFRQAGESMAKLGVAEVDFTQKRDHCAISCITQQSGSGGVGLEGGKEWPSLLAPRQPILSFSHHSPSCKQPPACLYPQQKDLPLSRDHPPWTHKEPLLCACSVKSTSL